MNIFADNFVERTTRNKKTTYLNFNVIFSLGDEVIYSVGWQLFSGHINPPSYSKGGRFFPNLHLSPPLAEAVYLAVKESMPGGYELGTIDDVVPSMQLTRAEFLRLFPNVENR
jgi:hypothetical protein